MGNTKVMVPPRRLWAGRVGTRRPRALRDMALVRVVAAGESSTAPRAVDPWLATVPDVLGQLRASVRAKTDRAMIALLHTVRVSALPH
jgi:hypothetical protein